MGPTDDPTADQPTRYPDYDEPVEVGETGDADDALAEDRQ